MYSTSDDVELIIQAVPSPGKARKDALSWRKEDRTLFWEGRCCLSILDRQVIILIVSTSSPRAGEGERTTSCKKKGEEFHLALVYVHDPDNPMNIFYQMDGISDNEKA